MTKLPQKAVSTPPRGRKAWVEALSGRNLMSLATLIQELTSLVESDRSSVPQLASVVTRDPGLTSRVLRIANSASYNPAGSEISTVSRAIINIGFETVRAICISASVLDKLLPQQAQSGLLRQMALSFVASIQARNLCERMRSDTREEVFVATLLLHLGRLLLWSYPHPIAARAWALHQKDPRESAQKSLLGTTYRAITHELARQWNLGPTLLEALQTEPLQARPGSSAGAAVDNRRIQTVHTAEAIAQSISKGWDSPEMKASIDDVVSLLEVPPELARQRVRASFDEALRLSEAYNDPRVTQLMQSIDKPPAATAKQKPEPRKPDPQRQLAILQEIMQMLVEGVDSARLFRLTLQGLHEGVGLERVGLMLINPPRNQIHLRFCLGLGTESWRDKVRCDYEKDSGNLFYSLAQESGLQFIDLQRVSEWSDKVPRGLRQIFDQGQFLIGALLASQRDIGVIIADMGTSQSEIDAERIKGFSHFMQQANVCLDVLALRSRAG